MDASPIPILTTKRRPLVYAAHRWLVLWLFFALCVEQRCDAQQSWPLWESYKSHIIDRQGRVVDHSAQDRTTSEGQAYAMFFALVANDRPRFDEPR